MLVLDPIFGVGAFVRARCLGGTIAAATSVAAFAAADVVVAEGFCGEGSDLGHYALDHSPHCGQFSGVG